MSEQEAANDGRSVARLVAIVKALLGPGGCPWDREQTHASLRSYVIEEAYEVVEAIDSGEPAQLCEELGDLLMQVVLHAELAASAGAFTLDDVVSGICDKLTRRHPHVFGELSLSDSGEVLRRWDQLKRQEGRESLCDGVPRSLPALRRGQKLGERLGRAGFDWPDARGPRAKIDEELRELDEAVSGGERQRMEEELGDLLFAAVSLGRHLELDAEDALRGTLARFESRFRAVEAILLSKGLSPEDCTLEELDSLWEEIKAAERPLDR